MEVIYRMDKTKIDEITRENSTFFSRQKFRFDMATQILIVINYILLAITASDNVQMLLTNIFGVEIGIYWIILGLIVLAIIGVWAIGLYMDVKAKYWESIVTEQNIRNPHVMRMIENTEITRQILEGKK